MSILSGYDKYKRYQKVDDDNYKLVSHWTSSNTVQFDDDSTAEEKVAEIDNSISEINSSISTINNSIDSIEENLSNLNTDVEELFEKEATSSQDIATLKSEKATRTELAETNENLSDLETQLNYHEENSQKAELISYDNRISGLNANKVQDAIDDVNNKADEALTVAKGKNRSIVFETTSDMQTWLSNAENKEKCQVGDNVYIEQIDVPDWWIAEVLTEADADTGYYYKVAQLETQKVDLSSLEDEIAGKVAKLDDALIWQGQISGDDWATAELGIWSTTTENETYGIPSYSVIYKPRPTSFTGAFINCYANGTQRGIYAWDASESKFIRLPRMDEFDTRNLKTYTSVTQLGLTTDNTLDDIFSAMPQYSQLMIVIPSGKNLGGSLPNTKTAELIVTKTNNERAVAVRTQYESGARQINHCYGKEWTGWKTLAISASNNTVRFQGINLSASDIAYIYTEDDNVNFRYKTSTGATAYANIRSIHGLLESVGSTLHSEKPVNETIVADGAEIVSLTIPGGGKWIITAYAGGRKILLKTDGDGIYKYGINPTVYMPTSGGVVRMINKSGNSITVYADITQYYITAIRIG